MYKSTKLQTSHVQEYKLQATNFSITRVQNYKSLILRNYKAPNLLCTRVQNYQTNKPILNKTIKQPKKFYKLLNNQIKIIQNYQTTHNPYFTKLSNKQTHISQNYQTNQPIFYKTIKQTNPSIYKFGLSVCLFVCL